MTIKLSGLNYFPVKSLRGESPQQWDVGVNGLVGDRRWMLIDEQGKFVTQRQQNRMALVNTRFDADKLIISAPGMSDLILPGDPQGGDEILALIWGDTVMARSAGAEAGAWLSEFLATAVRLVYFPGEVTRQVDMDYAHDGDQTAFADGFPFLLISQASLADLNQRMGLELPMIRFRPNLVVSGTEPYAEDRWRKIRIGEMTFRVVKPCSRCIIPTIDPQTAERSQEPLRTLAGYRRNGNRVYFGQNLLHDGTGTLSLGDDVEILEMADE